MTFQSVKGNPASYTQCHLFEVFYSSSLNQIYGINSAPLGFFCSISAGVLETKQKF